MNKEKDFELVCNSCFTPGHGTSRSKLCINYNLNKKDQSNSKIEFDSAYYKSACSSCNREGHADSNSVFCRNYQKKTKETIGKTSTMEVILSFY